MLILILILFILTIIIGGLLTTILILKLNSLKKEILLSNNLLKNEVNVILKELELAKKFSKEKLMLIKRVDAELKVNTKKWLDLEVSVNPLREPSNINTTLNKGF